MKTSGSPCSRRHFVCALLFIASSAIATADEPATTGTDKVDAAALVRKIRQQEDWIDRVASFQLRTESKWTRSAKSIEIERKKLENQFPGAELDPKQFMELRPELTDVIDVAFTTEKVRLTEDQRDFSRRQSTWDGARFVHYQNYMHHRQEGYSLTTEPMMFGPFSNFAWPAAQHHFFSWCLPKTEEDRKLVSAQFGEPEEYEYLGRDPFRGHDCHVLFRMQDTRLYIDVASGRLIGKTSGSVGTAAFNERGFQIAKRVSGQNFETREELENWFNSQSKEAQIKLRESMQSAFAAERPSDTPVFEYWMLDYKEVAPGCYYPMTQGYIINHVDEKGQAYESLRREIKVVKVAVNAKLPDSLFNVTMKDGVRVYDETYDPPLTYTVKANRTKEEWKQIVDEARKHAEADEAEKRELDSLIGRPAPDFPIESKWMNGKPLAWSDLKGRLVVVDFWAIGCGPCWNDIPLLQGMHDGAAKSDISIVAVHSAGAEAKDVQPFLDERKITYPIVLDATKSDEDGFGQIFNAFHVRRMPYSILVDRDGRVIAHGSLHSLIEKITEMRAEAK
jgi:thiol-disulfide isomerase/thioredoxin